MKYDNIEEVNPQAEAQERQSRLIEETREKYTAAATESERKGVLLDALNSEVMQHRSCAVRHTRSEDDQQNSIIEFSFSSETPVERWWGIEVLDHKTSSVRLERMNNGAPLLLDHEATAEKHIGVIESARIEKGVGRAVARLGRNLKSKEALTDIEDGILRNVSVGYVIHDLVLEEDREGQPPIYRVKDWEPLEASLLPLAADPQVGIGRGYQLQMRQKVMSDQEMTTAQDKDIDITAVRNEAEETARAAEISRIREINAVSRMYRDNAQIVALCERAQETGLSMEEFRAQAIPLFRSKPVPAEDKPVTEIGMSSREVESFSLVRAIRALITAKVQGTDAARLAPFEFECSAAVSEELDKEARGFFVPWDVQRAGGWPRGRRQVRAVPMDTSENADLVATEHLAGSFIDALFERSTVLRLGAITLPGLTGNVDIPGFSAAMSWGWLTEDASSADTEPTTKTVALTPKTVSGSVPITRRLIKQSSPAIEQLLRGHMVAGSSEAIDSGAIQGSGASGQPTGILNTTGINTEAITVAGQPTHADLVNFEIALATDKALFGNLSYTMTPAVMSHCKTTVLDAGSGRFLVNDGVCNGYPAEMTTNMPANGVLFGNWSSVIIGMWGVLDITLDNATKAATGGLVIRAFQDLDVGVQHAVGFCKNA